EARVEVVVEPVPDVFAVSIALGFGPRFHRIVDDDQRRAKTGHAAPDADGAKPAAGGSFPFGDGIGRPGRREGKGRIGFGGRRTALLPRGVLGAAAAAAAFIPGG